jgi:hypothetical protein
MRQIDRQTERKRNIEIEGQREREN